MTLAATLPGLLVSPIAGALLDRHGRMRLVRLDYVVALVALALIAILSLLDALPPWLLVLITAVSSLTAILSQTGLRSLFPIIVPEHLWERVNAVDSNGYVIATIFGPPLAAGLVAIVGGPLALLGTAVAFGLAALAMLGIPDPPTAIDSTGRLLRDALDGLRYAWRNPTIRGLAFSISSLNLAGGITTIAVPAHRPRPARLLRGIFVGVVFALSGIAGMVSALIFGRMDTRDREWPLLVYPMVVFAPTLLLLLPPAVIDGIDPVVGLLCLAALGGHRRPRQRPARHRAVHDPPATNRSGLDRPGVRRVDGDELPRLPDRGGDRRRARRSIARPRDRARDRRGPRGRRLRRDDGPADGPKPWIRRTGGAGRGLTWPARDDAGAGQSSWDRITTEYGPSPTARLWLMPSRGSASRRRRPTRPSRTPGRSHPSRS